MFLRAVFTRATAADTHCPVVMAVCATAVPRAGSTALSEPSVVLSVDNISYMMSDDLEATITWLTRIITLLLPVR